MANSAFTPSILTIPATTTGSGQGELNIVTNPSAVTDTTGWAASGLTLTKDSSGSPLDPIVPTGFNLSASATSQTFTSSALTVPSTLRNKKLKLEFYYSYTSGSSFTVDVLDGSDVQYALTTDSSGTTTLAQMTGKFVCYFDSNNTSTCKVKLTSTGSGAMKITQIIVGPGIQPQGAVVGEWQSYTSGSTVLPAGLTTEYRRIGSGINVRIVGKTSGTSSSVWVIGLPSGATFLSSYDVNQPLQGSAELEDSVSTGAVFHGAVVYASSTTFKIKASDKTTNAYWGNTTPLSFATNSGYRVEVDMWASITEWSGSGTVQLAQNDVEYAYNTSIGDSSNTSAFGYGPSGARFSSVTAARAKRIQFQTPIQAGDNIRLEVSADSGVTWLQVEQSGFICPNARQNTATYGTYFDYISSTQLDVVFNTFRLTSGATFGANGTDWSVPAASASYLWRVRKSSAGAAVGFGVVNSVSTGLVTPMTAQTALTASASSPTATITRAVGIAYTDIGGVWRLRFNIMWTVASGTRTSATLTLSGVTFKNVTNLAQAISVTSNVGASAYQQGYVNPNTGVITVEHASATTTSYYVSGDVELESKPTWA